LPRVRYQRKRQHSSLVCRRWVECAGSVDTFSPPDLRYGRRRASEVKRPFSATNAGVGGLAATWGERLLFGEGAVQRPNRLLNLALAGCDIQGDLHSKTQFRREWQFPAHCPTSRPSVDDTAQNHGVLIVRNCRGLHQPSSVCDQNTRFTVTKSCPRFGRRVAAFDQ